MSPVWFSSIVPTDVIKYISFANLENAKEYLVIKSSNIKKVKNVFQLQLQPVDGIL